MEVTINGLGERAGNASLEEVVMALRTRPNQFPELTAQVQTEQLTPASRLVSYLTGFAVQPNKAIVGANAFAHESGIHQDGFLKNPLTYEIMTPQSVGLSGNTLSIGKLSGRRGLQGKLRELGHEVDGEALDAVYRAAIALADAKKDVTDADLIALVEQRHADVPRSIELLGWNISSSSGGHSVGSASLVVAGEAKAANATGNGPVNALFAAVDEAVQPVLGWHPVLTEYEIKAVSAGEDAQGQVLVRCRRSHDEGPGALVVTGPRAVDQHHRGVARGVPRGGQQAPRRRDQRDRGRVRRPAHGRGAAMTDGEAGLRYRIALIPGDGVGPEVVAGAVGVLEAAGARVRLRVRLGGAGRRRDRASTPTASPSDPRTSRRAARPTPCSSARAAARSGTTPTPPCGPSRRCSRCAAASACSPTFARSPSHPALIDTSPLKPELLEGVDCLIVRELTSGLYFGRPSEQRVTAEGRAAIDTLWYTEGEIRRIVTLAFELARTRRGRSPRSTRPTCSPRRACGARSPRRSAPSSRTSTLEHRLVDSAAMPLAKRPPPSTSS